MEQGREEGKGKGRRREREGKAMGKRREREEGSEREDCLNSEKVKLPGQYKCTLRCTQ